MNPQQQPYEAPQGPQSNYDFFLNAEKPPKRKLLPNLGGGSSLAVRAVVIAVLLFAVIIIVAIGISLFGGSGKQPKLLTVAQDQNELVRVATEATTTGQDQSTQTTLNFAESAMLGLTSDQLQLTNYMAAHGGKPSAGQLAATKNTSTDTTLSNSIASSSFNATFINIMQNQLKSYEADLQSAFQSANTTAEKQLLTNEYGNAKLLLQQLNSPTQ